MNWIMAAKTELNKIMAAKTELNKSLKKRIRNWKPNYVDMKN